MFDWRNKSDQDIADFYVAAYGWLVQERQCYEPLFELIIKLFSPRRRSLLKPQASQKGRQYGAQIYTGTPALSARKFSRALFGHMSSRNVNDPWWLRFTTAHQETMEIDRVKEALQKSQDQVRYGFNQSNFYNQGEPLLHEAGTIGTGVALAKENRIKDCITFEVQHPKSNYIADNQFGDVDLYMRPVSMTAKTALEMFGKDALPAQIVKEAEGDKPFKIYEFLHSVDVNGGGLRGGKHTLDKPYLQTYILRSGPKEEPGAELIEKKGVDWFPIVLRFGVEPGAVYGTGPAADAMTEALIGNKLSQKHLQMIHAQTEPPILAHSSLRADLHLNPAGRTFTDDMVAKRAEFILNRQDWRPSEYELQKIDAEVKEIFGLPLFELLTQTGDQPQKTAYETRQMIAEKLPQVVPLIEAAEDDLLEPASNVIWIDETRKGRMPDLPPEVLDQTIDGYKRSRRIINEYMGRVAQLRRSVDEVNATESAIVMLKALGEMFPSALAKVKELQFIERALLTVGIPQKDLRGDDEVEQIMQAAAAKEQLAEQLEAGERISKMVPGLSQAPEPNSPAAMLAGAGVP
jgi:hypothetical protein